MNRPTIDLVMLIIAGVIAFAVVGGIVGIIVLELVNPDIDTESMIRVEGEILAVLTGALVGFISGRFVGRTEVKE